MHERRVCTHFFATIQGRAAGPDPDTLIGFSFWKNSDLNTFLRSVWIQFWSEHPDPKFNIHSTFNNHLLVNVTMKYFAKYFDYNIRCWGIRIRSSSTRDPQPLSVLRLQAASLTNKNQRNVWNNFFLSVLISSISIIHVVYSHPLKKQVRRPLCLATKVDKIRLKAKKNILSMIWRCFFSHDNKIIEIKNCQLPHINQIVGKTYQHNLYKTFDVISRGKINVQSIKKYG